MPTDTPQTTPSKSHELHFDDAPLDTLLFGGEGGPTPADLFAPSAAQRMAIQSAWAAGRASDALRLTRELLAQDAPFTMQDTTMTLASIGALIPDCSLPMIREDRLAAEPILTVILDRAMRSGRHAVAGHAGSILTRLLEARGRFEDSAEILATLLTMARLRRDRVEIPQWANNLGFTLGLLGRWAKAERYCEEAVAGFTAIDASDRANNALANLLTARLHHLGFPDALALEPEIEAVDQRYLQNGDWRRRKTLVLLARIREHLGDLPAALDLVDLALALSRGVRTLHRREDARYRRDLMGTLKRLMGATAEHRDPRRRGKTAWSSDRPP